MNPIMMGILVRTKQIEMIHEARNQKVFANGQAGDHSESLKKMVVSLATTGVIIILVVLAIWAI